MLSLVKGGKGDASILFFWRIMGTLKVREATRKAVYVFDPPGNRVIKENPNAALHYTTAGNRLSQVSHGGSAAKGGIPLPAGKVWSYSYDEAGRLMNRLYPNGIATNYEYNEANWLTLMAHTSGQHPLMSFQYTHDNVGNRTSKTITDGEEQHVWGYSYDALSRLTREVYPDTHDVVYTYDSNGNRLSRAGNGETVNYSYDAADQLLTAGAINCRWDGNGNLTRKADGNGTTNYQYDNENLLTKITLPDGTTESYVYNGNGLRVQKSRSRITTDYLLSGSDVLKEDTLGQGSRLSTYYVLGGSMAGPLALKQLSEQAPVYHYPLTDAQGSVMMLTDEGGNITDGYGYDAFGMGMTPPNPPPNQTYNPYRYTGQQSDSTSGLIYLRARYYDPQVGRFITSDPIGFLGGMNYYAYCSNNPLIFIDPLGLCGGGVLEGALNAANAILNAATNVVAYFDNLIVETREFGGESWGVAEGILIAVGAAATLGVGVLIAGEAIGVINSIVIAGGSSSSSLILSADRLAHIIERHTPGGSATANTSVFLAGEDIPALIRAAENVTPVAQRVGQNLQRVVDAGRIIGTERATGQPTSTYTVIHDIMNYVRTMFPGSPNPGR